MALHRSVREQPDHDLRKRGRRGLPFLPRTVEVCELLRGTGTGVCDPCSCAGPLQQARKQIHKIPDHLHLGEQPAGGGDLHRMQSVGAKVSSVNLSR